METIIVNGIVLFAALFLVRWLYKNMFAKKNEASCGSCENCGPEEGTTAAPQTDTVVPTSSSNE